MAEHGASLPRFSFSRRDPGAILALAERRRRVGKGVTVLALGGQPRDRVYCAQLLADAAGQSFVHIDLGLNETAPADDKAALEKLFAFARATPTTVLIDGAETVFARIDRLPGERAKLLGGYLKRSVAAFDGDVVFGMPEKVEADYARVPALDMEVTFRAPSGQVVAGKPVLLPSHVIDPELLPAHRFQVWVDDVELGLCAVSAPQLNAGPYSEFDFSPVHGVEVFASLPAEQRTEWPTLTLRRAVGQSTLFYDWKQAQYGGKPLVRELRIRQLDWHGKRVVNTWVVAGCWAKAWRGPEFDAMRTGVAVEELDLYYQSVAWR